MLRAGRPQRPTRQDCGPLLIEVPCPTWYYSKEQASWKCYEHRHGESSLLSSSPYPSLTRHDLSEFLRHGTQHSMLCWVPCLMADGNTVVVLSQLSRARHCARLA